MSDLYDRDVAAWATEQAQALRARSTDTLDWDNLAAEIADVRKRYEDQIENRLITLCAHLLKWQFQPEMRSNSWRGAVIRSRDRIARLAAKPLFCGRQSVHCRLLHSGLTPAATTATQSH